ECPIGSPRQKVQFAGVRVFVNKIVVLIGGVSVPEADQALDCPESQKSVQLHQLADFAKRQRTGLRQKVCQAADRGAIVFALVRLGLQFVDRLGIKVCQRPLVQASRSIAETVLEKWPTY